MGTELALPPQFRVSKSMALIGFIMHNDDLCRTVLPRNKAVHVSALVTNQFRIQYASTLPAQILFWRNKTDAKSQKSSLYRFYLRAKDEMAPP